MLCIWYLYVWLFFNLFWLDNWLVLGFNFLFLFKDFLFLGGELLFELKIRVIKCWEK